MHHKRINKMAIKLSNAPPGSTAYLRSYTTAHQKVEKKLTESQRQKYKAMAKDWSDKKLPPKVQYRYARQ